MGRELWEVLEFSGKFWSLEKKGRQWRGRSLQRGNAGANGLQKEIVAELLCCTDLLRINLVSIPKVFWRNAGKYYDLRR